MGAGAPICRSLQETPDAVRDERGFILSLWISGYDQDLGSLPDWPAILASIPPLYRTTHGGQLVRRAMTGLGHLLHRFEQVAARIWRRLYTRSIEPPAILQFIVRVKAEEIRRALKARATSCDSSIT
jgi:hypothetical protein